MAQGTVKGFKAQKGCGMDRPGCSTKGVFVHISAVEQAGMSNLNEGQKISYEMVTDRRSGKVSAGNLQAV